MDCRKFDEQVVRLDKPVGDLADQFVLVRLTRIMGADLNVFDFDYDLNFFVFFLNAEEKVYGRYGGREPASAEARLSLAGLHYAMAAALEAHRREPKAEPAAAAKKPLLVEDYPAARRRRGECIHCHQVWEYRRDFLKKEGKLQRDDLWVYPQPENVGLTLEVDQGNKVRSVAADSASAKAGLRAADVVQCLNGYSVASIGDAQYALHRGPTKGEVPVSWLRDGKTLTAKLELAEGWRKTNVTWRPSMLDLLPGLTIFGEDLTDEEKKALGLSEKRLAFRQESPVANDAKAAGVMADDIILGVDGKEMEMTMKQFLAHVRRNYLAGDRITLNVLRGGKRVDLPLTLR